MTRRDFDYGSFRAHKIDPLIINNGGNWKTQKETEARGVFKELNFKTLLTYFENSIKAGIEKNKNKPSTVIQSRRKYIKRVFPEIKHQNLANTRWESEQIKKYHNSNSIFKRYKELVQSDKLCQEIAIEELIKVNSFKSSIDRLLYITDYKKYCENEILKIGVYKELVPRPVTLELIFKKRDQYNALVHFLLEKKLIQKESINGEFGEKTFYFVHKELQPEKKNVWRQICALGYLLMKNDFLNTSSRPEITKALNHFFGENYSHQSTNKNFKRFENQIDSENDEDLNFFKMINSL